MSKPITITNVRTILTAPETTPLVVVKIETSEPGLSTVTPHMPFFEFVPPALCESELRKHLVVDEISMSDGKVTIPQKPGLGVEINRDALAEFVAAARKLRP